MPEETNDTLTMYIIVREGLGMGVGKMCAEACHGVQSCLLYYFKAEVLGAKLHWNETEQLKTMTEWFANGSRKIVLKADEEEWTKLRNEPEKGVFVVKNVGLSGGIEPGTETVMCVMPQHKSQVSKTIKKLSALK
jgi:peptidyl-tRNA hydrolase